MNPWIYSHWFSIVLNLIMGVSLIFTVGGLVCLGILLFKGDTKP